MEEHVTAAHTDDQPHKCNICDAAFARASQLLSHTRKHTGKYPFNCDQCGAPFQSRNNLTECISCTKSN